MRLTVCTTCEGRGASSAYLGAFTSDDMAEAGQDFVDEYMAGRYDRPCADCKGRNVVPVCKSTGCNEARAFVPGYFGNTEGQGCYEHDADVREAVESEAMSASERAYGC